MSYLSALISNWKLAESKTKKIWFTFSEFGGEEQRFLYHTGCCLHILALGHKGHGCELLGLVEWHHDLRERGEWRSCRNRGVLLCDSAKDPAWTLLLQENLQEIQWYPEQNRWPQPPLLLSNQKEAKVQPLVRPTWFTSQSMIIWGSVPTLLPSQAVRPTVPYFLSIELLMDFAPLCPIPLLWICWISKPEVKPALAIFYSPNHTFNNHKNHIIVIVSLLIFNRCLCISLYLILEKKLYTGFGQIPSPVRQMRLEGQIS